MICIQKKLDINLIRDNYEKIFYKIIEKSQMFVCRGMQLLANIYNIKLYKTMDMLKKSYD